MGPKRVLDDAEQNAISVLCSPILSLETFPDAAVPVTVAETSTGPSSTVRPYEKKLKTKQEGGFTELVREIIVRSGTFPFQDVTL